MGALPAARTYNQSHVARAHTGGRRISIYWTWSYPWEAQREPTEMYNRFSTMTEVRNALWPSYETPEYDEAHFLQGIAGTLELFHRSALASRTWLAKPPATRSPSSSASTRRATSSRSTSGSLPTPTP
jgi:hypothetical protein